MNIISPKCHGYSQTGGDILMSVLVFAAIAVTMTVGLVNWGAALLTSARIAVRSEQAFEIAEAGIGYYQYAINNSGSYTHDFSDKDGNVIGSYILNITPAKVGSSNIDVLSKGIVLVNPSDPGSQTISKTVEAVLAKPSFSQYAIVANDNLVFTNGTSVYGPVMSNSSIIFDGIAYNTISSASTISGSGTFNAGKSEYVPVVDFSVLSNNFQSLQTLASTTGFDYPQSKYSDKPAYGYHLVLNTDGTFGLYIVTALVAVPDGCLASGADITNWGTWSIQSQVLVGVYPLPSQELLSFEDNVWVDGIIDGTRLTIIATNITINNDLVYTNYDGTDSLGLFAQNDVNIGLVSADDFRIDAALFAISGRVGRFYYSNDCRVGGVDHSRPNTLTLDGMIATNKSFGFTYTDGTGYQNRHISYDVNLLKYPPPYIPLLDAIDQGSGQYRVVSWKEVQ